MIRTQVTSLLRNRVLHQNMILATMSTVISVVAGLVSAPIVASLLPRESYGALSYVQSIQGLILAFSAPGVANAIAYGVARGYEGTFCQGTYYRLQICLRNSLLILPLAGWYLWIEKNPSLALLITLGGLLLPWAYAFDTGEQFLVGRSDFSAIFWRRTAGTVLIAASGIAAAYLAPTALAVFLGRQFIMVMVTVGIFFLLLSSVRNHEIDPEFRTKGREFSQVSVLSTVGELTDRLVLGKSGTLGLLAGYSLALAATSPLDALSKSLIKVTFGKMAQRRDIQQRRFLVLASSLMVFVGAPLLVLMWQVVLPLALVLFPKYPELAYLIPILLINSALNFGAAIGQTWSLFQSYALWKRYYLVRNASRIPFTIVAVLIGGVWGALYVRLGYNVADVLFFNFLLWRGEKPNPSVEVKSVADQLVETPGGSQSKTRFHNQASGGEHL